MYCNRKHIFDNDLIIFSIIFISVTYCCSLQFLCTTCSWSKLTWGLPHRLVCWFQYFYIVLPTATPFCSPQWEQQYRFSLLLHQIMCNLLTWTLCKDKSEVMLHEITMSPTNTISSDACSIQCVHLNFNGTFIKYLMQKHQQKCRNDNRIPYTHNP